MSPGMTKMRVPNLKRGETTEPNAVRPHPTQEGCYELLADSRQRVHCWNQFGNEAAAYIVLEGSDDRRDKCPRRELKRDEGCDGAVAVELPVAQPRMGDTGRGHATQATVRRGGVRQGAECDAIAKRLRR